MAGLTIRAEILKLARLCRVDAGQLEFLDGVPAPQLRMFREAVQDSLFAGDDAVLFKRLGAAGALLPLALVAFLAQKVFGPVLGARVAGEMSAQRAIALAARLPVEFLADISVELDPARARDILRGLPPERIRDVARELLARGEFVTMGRFVGYLTHEAIRATLDAFTRPGDLLRVAFFVEDQARLDEIVGMMADARLMDVMRAAQADPDGLWAQAVALLRDISVPLKRKLGELVTGQPPEVLASLAQAAHRQQLWDDILQVVACMSEPAQRRVATLPALCSAEIMGSVLVSADAGALWKDLLPLVDFMEEPQLRSMADAATSALPVEALGRALNAANAGGKWEAILRLARGMSAAQLDRVGAAAETLPKNAIAGLLLMADERGLWDAFLPIAAGLSDPLRRQVAELAVVATPAMRERIIDAARAAPQALWPALLKVIALVPPPQRVAYAETVARRARAEPGLVERLAPAAETLGLQDLLQIARTALSQPSQSE
ncbi:MAG: hypothetical protein EPN72_11475 [Nevskiaceae bacterium]|nr:MAG: hypothetical protein EPN63_01505 [Nevskiaceae bacterium]TBR71816.1 MAG: hypothetical protein EPN72_11475 [Nevskiaceae bacterium]